MENKQILNSIDFIYLSLLSRRIEADDFIQEKTRLANNAKMKIHFFRLTECIIVPNFCSALVYYSSQFMNENQTNSNNRKGKKLF